MPVEQDRYDLCGIVALQALRHPDVLTRGRRRALEAVEVEDFADVTTMSEGEFVRRYSVGDITADEAKDIYAFLKAYPKLLLEAEKADIFAMSVQSRELSETDTLLALPNVCGLLELFTIRLLDAPTDAEFILGDTPMPQDHLAQGFTLPLSKALAIHMWHETALPPSISRVAVSREVVEASNQWQWKHRANIVVGSSRQLLESL